MSSLEFVGKFIGGDEITSVENSGRKTPSGGKIIDFTVKGDKIIPLSEKSAPYLITDEVGDLTKLQQRRLEPIIRECIGVCMEYDMDYGDMEAFTTQLMSNLGFQFTRAENILWGRKDEDFVPGYDPLYGITLLDAYRVLEENDGTESDSGESGAAA